MDEVLQLLARTVLPDREAHNSRLFVELCENVQIHHRESRVVFSLAEYFEYADVIAKSTRDIRNYLAQNPDYREGAYGTTLMIAGGPVGQKKLLQNSPRPDRSAYFPNDFAIELQVESATDEIHVHWRDFRMVMPREHFKIIAEHFAQAARKLADWEQSHDSVRRPHRDRQIEEPEHKRAAFAAHESGLSGEVLIPLDKLGTQFADIDREFKPNSEAIAILAHAYRLRKMVFPILVSREDDGRHLIIDGNHRFYAARKAGLTTINCVIAPMTFAESKSLREAETLLKDFDARTGWQLNVSAFNREFVAYRNNWHYRDHFARKLNPAEARRGGPPPIYRKCFAQTLVSGRDVVLIGSAPSFDGYVAKNADEVVACVNGSALAIKSGIIPDITFVNTSVAGTRQAGEETYRLLDRVRTRHAVVLEGAPGFSEGWLGILDRIYFNSFDFVSLEARLFLLSRFLGELRGIQGDALPSSGFYALLALLAHGARSVKLLGFSLVDGHSYLGPTFPRHHVDMDRRVLALITAKGYPVTGSVTTNSGVISFSETPQRAGAADTGRTGDNGLPAG